MRNIINIIEGAESKALKRTINNNPVVGDWPDILPNGKAIGEYIARLNRDNDAEALADFFEGKSAKLKIVSVNAIREGHDAVNIPDPAKQEDFNGRDISTMPPIVVMGGEVIDGNHRFRAAVRQGITHLAVYEVGGSIMEGVIVLGSGGSSKAKQAFNEFVSLTNDHPFDSRARLTSNASVELSVFDGALHISDVKAITPQAGGGSEAMQLICDLADKHNCKVTLSAKAYLDGYMSTAQLKAWYERFGFEVEEDTFGDDEEGYDMIRWPR